MTDHPLPQCPPYGFWMVLGSQTSERCCFRSPLIFQCNIHQEFLGVRQFFYPQDTDQNRWLRDYGMWRVKDLATPSALRKLLHTRSQSLFCTRDGLNLGTTAPTCKQHMQNTIESLHETTPVMKCCHSPDVKKSVSAKMKYSVAELQRSHWSSRKFWNVVWGSDSMCARRPFKSLGATFCADGDGEHPVNFLNFATWVASMTWMCSIPAHTGGYSHDILCLDLWKYNISNYHLYCGSVCICRYKK